MVILASVTSRTERARLTAGPDELDNLAVKSEHGATLKRLRAAAVAELRRTNARFVDGMPAVRKGA